VPRLFVCGGPPSKWNTEKLKRELHFLFFWILVARFVGAEAWLHPRHEVVWNGKSVGRT